MVQSKMLLDSNSYFRLGNSIHPLLFVEFGDPKYCLYVLSELDAEFNRNQRLQTKFPWVNEPEYIENRIKKLTRSKKDEKNIKITYDYLWAEVVANYQNISPVDVTVLSYGYVLGIPVVTDDGDMRTLAAAFGIQTLKTLELLDLMLKCGHITMEKIKKIAAYWAYLPDKPKNFFEDYTRLFNETPP